MCADGSREAESPKLPNYDHNFKGAIVLANFLKKNGSGLLSIL